jgi:hypothetical protein
MEKVDVWKGYEMLEKRSGTTTDKHNCNFDYDVFTEVEKEYCLERKKVVRRIISRVYTCDFLGLESDTLAGLKEKVSRA